jgi:ELWxxDGT repeat protein
MTKDLQSTPVLHCLPARKMCMALCILFLMICSAAHSQPVMLSNISPGSKNFTNVNGRLYYSSSDSLFSATSTSVPAFIFKTGEAITMISNMTVGSSFFFITQTAGGQKLWRSDGTASNTVALTTQTQITPLLVYHSQLFLRVNSSVTGVELWKVDGTYNVTMVKDVNPVGNGFVGSLAIHNDLLYFFGNTGSGTDLWQSDGTTSGTALSVDLEDTEAIRSI